MPSRRQRRTRNPALATIGIIVFFRQYRLALAAALEGKEGLIPVDLGSDGGESLRRLAHLRPQAVLVDLPRRRLATFLRAVHSHRPSLPILAVNVDEDEEELLALFEAGLAGFIPHDSDVDDLERIIRGALAGEVHCPPRIVAAIIRRVSEVVEDGDPPPLRRRLTAREEQVARLLVHSFTNKEIASQLGIGAETVRNHVYRICRKFRAHRRSEVVARLQSGRPDLRIVCGLEPESSK